MMMQQVLRVVRVQTVLSDELPEGLVAASNANDNLVLARQLHEDSLVDGFVEHIPSLADLFHANTVVRMHLEVLLHKNVHLVQLSISDLWNRPWRDTTANGGSFLRCLDSAGGPA